MYQYDFIFFGGQVEWNGKKIRLYARRAGSTKKKIRKRENKPAETSARWYRERFGGVDTNGNRHIFEEIFGKTRREEGEYRDVFNRRATLCCRKLTKNCHFYFVSTPPNEINEFLEENDLTKVRLIKEGYEALKKKKEHGTLTTDLP